MEPDEILGAEIIDVPGGSETHRCGEGSKADREIEIVVEKTVQQPADERVAGADSVDDIDRIPRRIAQLAAVQEQGAGFGLGRAGQGEERYAVAGYNCLSQPLPRLDKAEDALRVALGKDQQMQMWCGCFEHCARFQRGCQGGAIVQIV